MTQRERKAAERGIQSNSLLEWRRKWQLNIS